MGSRLELKYGLVADADRLATSADSMLASEPATGSKVRTKGNLYLVVSSGKVGGRARDATAQVADTIRREYYYDESAGVPICLEKAVRSANRKLRGSREGNGLPPGIIGIAVAVVRTNELYVATIGNAEAYLVRAARLLMPDHTATPGLPADDGLRVEVWRGEFAVGDSLLLVSRNLTEVVGTEELKNAVVTLHPQSAVEHLHHLFVAAGGDGSDAVLAVEATELAPSRGDRKLAPATAASDAYGDLPNGPIPGGDQVAGAASAVTGAFSGAASAVTGAVGGAVDRALDLMPRRSPSARSVTTQVSRRESQRRAAIALLSLLGVVLVLGLAIWLFPHGKENPVQNLTEGQRAFQAAQDGATRAAPMLTTDATQAQKILHQAWLDLQTSKTSGVPSSASDPLEATIRTELDSLYGGGHVRAQELLALGESADPIALVRGPDKDAPYFLDSDSRGLWRVDPKTNNAVQVVKVGDQSTGNARKTVGTLRLLGAGGPDVLFVDVNGNLFRWIPAGPNGAGQGQLKSYPYNQTTVWGSDVTAFDTYLAPHSLDLFNLYVVDPAVNQILRYQPTSDGGVFLAPQNYLASSTEDVSTFRQLFIDGDLFALTSDNVVKHRGGVQQSFKLQTPPDDGDLRPGHDYRWFDGTGDSGTGSLYVYDAKWDRILVFSKANGQYQAQWSTGGTAPPMKDVRGMYVVQPPTPKNATQPTPAIVTWLIPQGLYQSTLVESAKSQPTPSPLKSPRA